MRVQVHETTNRRIKKSLTYSSDPFPLRVPEELLKNLDSPTDSQSTLLKQYLEQGESGTSDEAFILLDTFLGTIGEEIKDVQINTGEKTDGLY